MMACPIVKEVAYHFQPVAIGDDQMYITASAGEKDVDPILVCGKLYHQIGSLLKRRDLRIVHERLFGSIVIRDELMKARLGSLHDCGIDQELPVTYVEGNPPWGAGFAGLQLYAVKSADIGGEVRTIYDGEVPCGRGWRRNGASFLLLQDIHGDISSGTRTDQTGRMFDLANDLLQREGMRYRDVIRTWIYLSDILKWYGEFNRVRNEKYLKYGLVPAKSNGGQTEDIYFPASTGIGGSNHRGSAAVMDVLAIGSGSASQISVAHNTGAKQKSPFRYGSAFSRSTVVREQNNKTIYVSGTASIAEDGRTLGIDNFGEQVRNTIEVVDSLIGREGASVKDICQSTVFLKRPDDYPEYECIMNDLGLGNIPAVCVLADVCRRDLLFEIDATVVTGDRENSPEDDYS